MNFYTVCMGTIIGKPLQGFCDSPTTVVLPFKLKTDAFRFGPGVWRLAWPMSGRQIAQTPRNWNWRLLPLKKAAVDGGTELLPPYESFATWLLTQIQTSSILFLDLKQGLCTLSTTTITIFDGMPQEFGSSVIVMASLLGDQTSCQILKYAECLY